MVEVVSFKLRMTGGLTDIHQIEAYDGYTSLAGAAFTLSLITNYVETGEIRHRGNFVGRHAVRALPMQPGSLIADLAVYLQGQPSSIFGAAAGASGAGLLYGLVNRVVSRNIGITPAPLNPETAALLKKKEGDIEALVAISEPSLRQAHEVIGNGADEVEWIGGINTMARLDTGTKHYMRSSIHDKELIVRDVPVSGFYGNTGHGSVFDPSLGRIVPIGMNKATLETYGPIFSWGLDQYTNRTGRKVRIKFTRILAVDGRPKRYVIGSATKAPISATS